MLYSQVKVPYELCPKCGAAKAVALIKGGIVCEYLLRGS